MSLSIIVAKTPANVIGVKNDLPWDLPKDLSYFASITKGNTVVMGRKTFESIKKKIGGPLPERRNVVLSSKVDTEEEGFEFINNWGSVIDLAKKEEVFIIGGASVYETALPYANTLYITEVDTDIEGDTFFPSFNYQNWQLTKSETHGKDEKNNYDMTFKVYERKDPIEFLDFDHARTTEQIELMKKIDKDGLCPFCEEYFKKYHPKEILKETNWWMVSENMSPYEGTQLHLLIVYKRHAVMPSEIKKEAYKELKEIFSWAEDHYGLSAGSFFMRFGDTRYTGGSVNHAHVQFLLGSAKSDDEKKSKLKIKLGYKKEE